MILNFDIALVGICLIICICAIFNFGFYKSVQTQAIIFLVINILIAIGIFIIRFKLTNLYKQKKLECCIKIWVVIRTIYYLIPAIYYIVAAAWLSGNVYILFIEAEEDLNRPPITTQSDHAFQPLMSNHGKVRRILSVSADVQGSVQEEILTMVWLGFAAWFLAIFFVWVLCLSCFALEALKNLYSNSVKNLDNDKDESNNQQIDINIDNLKSEPSHLDI